MCIFMGCVYAYVIFLTLIGPEYLRRSFSADQDSDVDEVAGHDVVERAKRRSLGNPLNEGDIHNAEKGTTQTKEQV